METESSLIVPVRAAMAVVEPWRERLDPFSLRGMLTHVTVLYPFLPSTRFDAALIAELGEIFAVVPSFRFELTTVKWFEPNVVWLAPQPDDQFRRMTAAVQERWPDLRPYGGPPKKVPPHLTVGVSESVDRLEEAARHVEPFLPIEGVAEEVLLMTGSSAPGSWSIESRFRLAAPIPGPSED